MSRVREIQSDEEFVSSGVASGPFALYFGATWCGACRVLGPQFDVLSTKFPTITFLKLDADTCQTIASAFHISKLPTVVLLQDATPLRRFEGFTPAELQASLERLAAGTLTAEAVAGAAEAAAAAACEVPGLKNLNGDIDKKQVECLNQSLENTVQNIFTESNSFLESDCDAQLIITIAFQQPVKLHSLKMMSPDVERAPKTIKVFINRTSSLDFDTAESLEPVQTLELTEKQAVSGELIPLKAVKYQAVTSITLFIKDNQSDADTTAMSFLQFIGDLREKTNMKEFQRVAGKKGEADH